MATDVADSRQNLFVEETNRNTSWSERLAQKFGGSINFINNRQHLKHSYHLNGDYILGEGSTGPDGWFPCLFDMEISGFFYTVGNSGSSSSTIVDVHLIDADGTDNGSIFSTLPEISATAANESSTTYDQIKSTVISNPTGHTLAVLSTTQADAGQKLRLDLDQASPEGKDFQLTIFYRPR